MSMKLYGAYGSNMDEGQMALRCKTARLMGKTTLENHVLSFKGIKGRAYATIEPSRQNTVPILVWEIESEDEKSLDRYEDYPKLYDKELVTVFIDQKLQEIMVYTMDKKMPQQLPDKTYYEIIEKAYKKFGFDLCILEEAWNRAASNVDKEIR